ATAPDALASPLGRRYTRAPAARSAPGPRRGWLLRSIPEDVGPVAVWSYGAGPLNRRTFHAHSFALEDGLMSSRGLEGVVVAETELSKIYGEEGRLVYRGYEIEDLAENATFE